jgi:hypothetical protein
MEQLGSDRVEVTLVKRADHRFCDESCLLLLQDKLDKMIEQLK